MKKVDFIEKCESWLVRDDFKDDCYRMTSSQMQKKDINQYLESAFAQIIDKGCDCDLIHFCQFIKGSYCRGIDANLKKKVEKYAKMKGCEC